MYSAIKYECVPLKCHVLIILEPSLDRGKHQKTVTIAQLAVNWKRQRFLEKQLIVRVLNKVRLRMYGKKEKRSKWPFQVCF